MNQKSKKCRGIQKKITVLFIINMFFAVLLTASLIIPSKGKKVMLSNMDISMYSSFESIPVIGAVTEDRAAEISFQLYGEKLYGICLYFYVGGQTDSISDDGSKLTCTLKSGEKQIGYTEVPIKELASMMSEESLNAKELVFDCDEVLAGEYTLLIEGEGIPADTRIALYGNRSTARHLEYVNVGYDKHDGILYSVEVVTSEHPFVWSAALLLALSFLFSCIIYMDDGEKC